MQSQRPADGQVSTIIHTGDIQSKRPADGQVSTTIHTGDIQSERPADGQVFTIIHTGDMQSQRPADGQVFTIIHVVVVVLLPRPMEGNGVTPIFRSLQNCQFHHRRLESLEHFNVFYIYIILSTTVSHF